MLLGWVRMWIAVNDGTRKKRKAFSDPLEGPEWQGLLWALPLLSPGGRKRPRGNPTRQGGGRRPGLSGWFRSSGGSRGGGIRR